MKVRNSLPEDVWLILVRYYAITHFAFPWPVQRPLTALLMSRLHRSDAVPPDREQAEFILPFLASFSHHSCLSSIIHTADAAATQLSGWVASAVGGMYWALGVGLGLSLGLVTQRLGFGLILVALLATLLPHSFLRIHSYSLFSNTLNTDLFLSKDFVQPG